MPFFIMEFFEFSKKKPPNLEKKKKRLIRDQHFFLKNNFVRQA